MINKKILAGVLLLSVVTAGIGSTFAADTASGSTTKIGISNNYKGLGGEKHFNLKEKGGKYSNLTDAEKTALKSMSSNDKKAFFEKKMEENKKKMEEIFAKNQLKEAVIDDLLAGKTLTTEQEALRAEIIKDRADRKAKMEQKKTEKGGKYGKMNKTK